MIPIAFALMSTSSEHPNDRRGWQSRQDRWLGNDARSRLRTARSRDHVIQRNDGSSAAGPASFDAKRRVCSVRDPTFKRR